MVGIRARGAQVQPGNGLHISVCKMGVVHKKYVLRMYLYVATFLAPYAKVVLIANLIAVDFLDAVNVPPSYYQHLQQ